MSPKSSTTSSTPSTAPSSTPSSPTTPTAPLLNKQSSKEVTPAAPCQWAGCTGCSPYTLTSTQGKALYARVWWPQGDVRGLVLLCHGYSEHLGWYERLAKALTEGGLGVFGHDHVGHGLSEGPRCFVRDAREYVEDVLLHASRPPQPPRPLAHAPPGQALPLYIVGHSMGGMIAIASALAPPPLFAGAVLMGPLISTDPREATPLKVRMAQFMAWLCPYFPVGRLDIGMVSRDKDHLSRVTKDALTYQGAIKAGWVAACLDLIGANKARLQDFRTPFVILHGEEDRLCALEGSREMVARAGAGDKTIKVFPKALHNLYQEILAVRDEAVRDTVQWITARLPQQ